MKKDLFIVDGMSCGHCTAAVTTAVKNLKGISDVTVTLADKTAAVVYDDSLISRETIIMAIEEEGFSVKR